MPKSLRYLCGHVFPHVNADSKKSLLSHASATIPMERLTSPSWSCYKKTGVNTETQWNAADGKACFPAPRGVCRSTPNGKHPRSSTPAQRCTGASQIISTPSSAPAQPCKHARLVQVRGKARCRLEPAVAKETSSLKIAKHTVNAPRRIR